MREVHNKKIHSYPKDVLIAAVIFAAAVCQWGGNHGKAAETVSFAALEDIAEKKVAITFDDGPNPDYTEELLEGLKERNVTASFFLLGKEAEKFPDIVKKIHEYILVINIRSCNRLCILISCFYLNGIIFHLRSNLLLNFVSCFIRAVDSVDCCPFKKSDWCSNKTPRHKHSRLPQGPWPRSVPSP